MIEATGWFWAIYIGLLVVAHGPMDRTRRAKTRRESEEVQRGAYQDVEGGMNHDP